MLCSRALSGQQSISLHSLYCICFQICSFVLVEMHYNLKIKVKKKKQIVIRVSIIRRNGLQKGPRKPEQLGLKCVKLKVCSQSSLPQTTARTRGCADTDSACRVRQKHSTLLKSELGIMLKKRLRDKKVRNLVYIRSKSK